MSRLSAVVANVATVESDTTLPAGITPEAWNAMDAATKAAIANLAAKSAKATAPRTVGVVLYAEGCDKRTSKDGEARSCFAEPGAKACPHGKPLKGNIGITGLGQFPMTAYSSQWLRVAEVWPTVLAESKRLVAAGIGVK